MDLKHHIGPLKWMFDLYVEYGTYIRFYILGMDLGSWEWLRKEKTDHMT